MVMLREKKNYYKAEIAKTGDIVTFTDPGEWVESAKFTNQDGTPRNDFIIKVLVNDAEEYSMRLNSTNRNFLITEFGRDTEKWVNRQATVEKMKINVGGKIMDSIMLSPIVAQEA